MGHQRRSAVLIVSLIIVHALPVMAYLGLSDETQEELALRLQVSISDDMWGMMVVAFFFYYFPLLLTFSQQALVAMWICFSQRHLVWRAVVGGGCLFISVLVVRPLSTDTSEAAVFLLAVSGSVVTLLFILRLLRVFVVDYEQFRREPSAVMAGAQFSLRQLLLGSIVVAIGLGCLSAFGDIEVLKNEPFAFLLMGFLVAVVSIAALWLALGVGRLWLRALVFLACTALPTGGQVWLVVVLNPDINGEELFWSLILATIPVIIGLICLLSLLVVRRCGYRLIRLRPGQEELALAEPESETGRLSP